MSATKIMICLGSGGVGKTTISAALAIQSALDGKRTLVLTIDPSQRLKSILNLNKFGEVITLSEPSLHGKLDALLIDPKKTFDNFIAESARSPDAAMSILNNGLYKQLSTNLSGSQDFTALEVLYSAHRSGKYDLIVLDTPPAGHAIDFLRAPQKLNALFNEGITSWFRPQQNRSLLKAVLHSGTKRILQTLELITGSQFIGELRDFFVHIKDWEDKLEDRTAAMHAMLVAPSTQFWLITNLDRPKLDEASHFVGEIRKGGYHLSGIIINRAFPDWLPKISKEDLAAEPRQLARLYESLWDYYSDKGNLYQKFTSQAINGVTVLRIPELEKAPSSFSDIVALCDLLRSGGF